MAPLELRVPHSLSREEIHRRIDAGLVHPLEAGAEVVDVLDACTWLEHVSGGAFRARRPVPGGAVDATWAPPVDVIHTPEAILLLSLCPNQGL